ncbi:MAG: transglycosylase SLT domain-containing protein [Microgenomates group bacterium]
MSISQTWQTMLAVTVFAVWSTMAFALDPREACFAAAKVAAAETSVPLRILTAVYSVETGAQREAQFSGWPWSLNIAGVGHRFDTKEQAKAFVEAALNAGKRNIDIGCFQINIRWHSRNFRSLTEMFDPTINATYAARYLLDLFAQHGDWKIAVGAYHSNDPARAELYVQKVEEQLYRLVGDASDVNRPQNVEIPSQNNFPLFQGSSSASAGSTFPLLAPNQPLIVVR